MKRGGAPTPKLQKRGGRQKKKKRLGINVYETGKRILFFMGGIEKEGWSALDNDDDDTRQRHEQRTWLWSRFVFVSLKRIEALFSWLSFLFVFLFVYFSSSLSLSYLCCFFFLSVCVVIDVSPVRVCHFILPHRDTHKKKKEEPRSGSKVYVGRWSDEKLQNKEGRMKTRSECAWLFLCACVLLLFFFCCCVCVVFSLDRKSVV